MWQVHPDLDVHLSLWSDSAAVFDLKSSAIWALSLAAYAVLEHLIEVNGDTAEGIAASLFDVEPTPTEMEQLQAVLHHLAENGLLTKSRA